MVQYWIYIVGCETCPSGYNDGCNDCICDENGNAACTKKACSVKGEPFCKPDCSTILCENPRCCRDEMKITPAGECCPKCVPGIKIYVYFAYQIYCFWIY